MASSSKGSSKKRGRAGGAGAASSSAENEGTDVKDTLRIKITSMGEGGVGKSCLIKRYCEEKFVSRYIATIGVDFGVKPVEIDGYDVKVNFWDLSGHPEFFDVRNEFYKDTQGVLLVFDVTQQHSFEALTGWMEEAKKYGVGRDTVWVVCGNKVDRSQRQVSKAVADDWAKSQGFKYFETSAKEGQSVDKVFQYLFQKVVQKVTSRH